MAREGGWDDDRGHSTQLPEDSAVGGIIGAHDLGTGDDQLRATVVAPDVGGRPVGAGFAFDSPERAPGGGIKGEQRRGFIVIVEKKELLAVEDGRGSGPPPKAGLARLNGEVPERLAGHIEAVEADISEEGVEALAIGDGSLRGITVLEVTGGLDRTTRRFAFPPDAPCPAIDRIDHPTMLFFGKVVALAPEVEPLLRTLDGSFGDDGGEEDLIAPDDRRGPAHSRNRCLPGDVLGRTPRLWQVGILGGYARGVRSPKLWPMVIPAARRTSRPRDWQ